VSGGAGRDRGFTQAENALGREIVWRRNASDHLTSARRGLIDWTSIAYFTRTVLALMGKGDGLSLGRRVTRRA
jgi:hypothetical protein